MALNYCQSCTTAYALSLDVCPHCRRPTTATVSELPAPAEVGAAPVADAEPPRRRPRREPPPETETAGDD